MGKVTYNQSGYVGSSMSERALEAYDHGEMPKSRWTKKAMLESIADYCETMEIPVPADVPNLKKAELFEKYFCWTSWHHTGKFANETDFYGIDEDAFE